MVTEFNPENKETLTWGEACDPAMEIITPWDAQQYLSAYTEFIKKLMRDHPENFVGNTKTAREIALNSILRYAGYCPSLTRRRVMRLFK